MAGSLRDEMREAAKRTMVKVAQPPQPLSSFARKPIIDPKERSQKPLIKAPGEKPWANSKREIRIVLSIYARSHRQVILRYTKKNGELVTRIVEPYSYRLITRRDGANILFLYAYDVQGPTIGIHSFAFSRIKSIVGTDQKFNPRWEVEL